MAVFDPVLTLNSLVFKYRRMSVWSVSGSCKDENNTEDYVRKKQLPERSCRFLAFHTEKHRRTHKSYFQNFLNYAQATHKSFGLVASLLAICVQYRQNLI